MRAFADMQFWPSSQSPPKQPVFTRMQPPGNDRGASVFSSDPFRSTSELQIKQNRYAASPNRPSTDRGSQPRMVNGAFWYKHDFADSVGLPRETNVLSLHVGESQKPKLIPRQRKRHEPRSTVSLADVANGQFHTTPVYEKIQLPPSVLKTELVTRCSAKETDTTVTDMVSVHSQRQTVEAPGVSELLNDVVLSDADKKETKMIIVENRTPVDVSSSSKESDRNDPEIISARVVTLVTKEEQNNMAKEITPSPSFTQDALLEGDKEIAGELETNSRVAAPKDPKEGANETNVISKWTRRMTASSVGVNRKCKDDKPSVLKLKSEKLLKKRHSDSKTQVRSKGSNVKRKDSKDTSKVLSGRLKADKNVDNGSSVSKRSVDVKSNSTDDEKRDDARQTLSNPSGSQFQFKSVLRKSSASKKPKERKSVQFDKELELVRLVTKIEYPWNKKTRDKKLKGNNVDECKAEDDADAAESDKKKNNANNRIDRKSDEDECGPESSEDDWVDTSVPDDNGKKSSPDDNDDKSYQDDDDIKSNQNESDNK